MRFVTTAFLGLFFVACGSSSSSTTPDAPDGSTPPGDDAGDAGGPLAISPGDVADLTVVNGIAGGTFAAENGKLVVVIASTLLDGSQDELAWSLDTTKAPADPRAHAEIATKC